MNEDCRKPEETVTVNAPAGKVKGYSTEKCLVFSSLRYADSERFKVSAAVKETEDFVEQSEKIPVCPQNISPFLDRMIGKSTVENFRSEESCQFLTITVPKKTEQEEPLPVLVWIHGGSYELGGGEAHISNPEMLVSEEKIIVVSLTYRLGFFGFLGGYDERPANLGLLDIIEGLKWIKRNISSFGGNPENITVMGQSSGGDAAAHLMISKGVEGLFHRVIIQSAPLGLRRKRQKMSRFFSEKLSEFLHEEDSDKILKAQRENAPSVMKFGLKAAMPFGTQYGFEPLPAEKDSLEKWKEKASKFDIMIGLNDEETAFYVAANENLEKRFHSGYAGKLIRKAVRLTTETIYGKPAKLFAKLFAKAGANVYQFRIHAGFEGKNYGAAHCIDLPLIFPHEENWKNTGLLQNIPMEEFSAYSEQMLKIWGSFIRTGTINPKLEIPEILDIRKV